MAHPGERIVLQGPSGAGKTTLLRLLEGSLAPTSGTVERAGTVALIYQDLRLVDELTARENVALGMQRDEPWYRGLASFRPEHLVAADELLLAVGLADELDRPVAQLSGGQRQRVAIARALANRPVVLLADEPFAHLDPETALQTAELLRRLQEEFGFALIASAHDPHKTPQFFTRTWSLLAPSDALPLEDSVPKARPRIATSWMVGIGLLTIVAAVPLFQSVPSWADVGTEAGRFLRNLVPLQAQAWSKVPWASLGSALLATLQMALVGTVLGALISAPLAISASLPGKAGWGTRAARGVANVLRAVPSLLWGLMAVAVFGIGPAAGVVALAAYSTGYLTRLFADTLESADRKPAIALRQLGVSRWKAAWHAVVRPSAPNLAGSTFFVFEYNVRAASVLGVVGAGGIGAELMYYLEWRQFASFTGGLLMVIGVAVLLDGVSRRLRERLMLCRGQ